ncbi:MAG: hypothetical protein E6G41_12655 [Actinobacteria bacterium]|nr:MAG: hypothetical protein E6G41_12655 [Actinomycetota bacterium]
MALDDAQTALELAHRGRCDRAAVEGERARDREDDRDQRDDRDVLDGGLSGRAAGAHAITMRGRV